MYSYVLKASIFLLICLSPFAHAQLTLEQLIDQTGIEPGETAVRDLPNWSGASKVVVRTNAMDVAEARKNFGDLEFIEAGSATEALAQAEGANGYIGNCDAAFIEAAEDLVWVQRTAAGVEGCVDIPRIANGEVLLTNMQKMDSPLIAEHAIAMMMSLSRALPRFVRNMEDNNWVRSREGMTSIVNKRLLVVGLGGIGTEVARFGDALGMHVSATRNSSKNGPSFVDYVGLSDELITLAAQSDVIVSALPLTESTTNLFDKEFFDALRSDAIFINVGRGKSVVTNDLYNALTTGKIVGAGLDVTEPEPLPSDHPLWDLPNLIITPHVSSGGSNRERRAVLLDENLRRFLAGDTLLNTVVPERGY